MNIEKTIKNSNFTISLGSTNNKNPRAIFINGRTFITPKYEKDDYENDINSIKKQFHSIIRNYLKHTPFFSTLFILNIDIPYTRMMHNKKTTFTFQIILKQKSEKAIDIKELKEIIEDDIIGLVSHFSGIIKDKNYIINKTKK